MIRATHDPEVRFNIQRRVGYSAAVIAYLVAFLNFIGDIKYGGSTPVEAVSDWLVWLILFFGTLMLLSTRKPGHFWQGLQVAVAVVNALLAMFDAGEDSLVSAPFVVFSMVLAIQYGFFERRFLLKVGFFVVLYTLGLYLTSVTLREQPVVQFFRDTAATLLFLYLFWVAFAEEIRQYVFQTERLSKETRLTREMNRKLDELVQERTRELALKNVELENSLTEKDLLLKEIHHRVKNNLGIMNSLLNLQARQSANPEVRAVLLESRNRIFSMAMVHEELYQSRSLSRINLQHYVATLLRDLETAYGTGPRHTTDLDIHEIELPLDRAIPCGIILTECLTNSFKYAFGDGETGRIYVSATVSDAGRVLLVIGDTGHGIPETLDIQSTRSFGIWLIYNLAREQLHGTISLRRDAGTEWRVEFPFS